VATDFRITDMHIVYWDGLKPTPTDKTNSLDAGLKARTIRTSRIDIAPFEHGPHLIL
jgi:hypothetical protein